MRRQQWIVGWGLMVLVLVAGCGSTQDAVAPTPEQRFERAKALYDNRDYLEAINEFTVITLQFQGSAVAAEAQYYIGESRFERGEYLLAAFEYGQVKRNYPASARVPDAQYKVGMSYYYLSPRPTLDQQYTKKAIDDLQAFVEYYPGHALAPDAEARIRELNTRLAKKQYDTARLYATMEYYKAAILSYDIVIEKFHDTDYAPLAMLDKVELLADRERYEEASKEIELFLSKYPNSVLRARADKLKLRIDQQMGSARPATPKQSAGTPPPPRDGRIGGGAQ